MEDFESWYERERPRVLSACFALGGDADAAQEATDEAFTRALERWRKVRAMAAPGGWVQVVALNHLRRSWRRRRFEALAFTARDSEVAATTPPDAELWMVVRGLPARQQAVIVLRYVHDLPEAAIAEAMGVARGTIASTLSAAHANLRRHMSEPIITKEPSHG